jgi:hypothetical protein
MNASTVPFAVSSKHASGGMSCPAGNTSIENRPPLISSTCFASRWAEPCITFSAGVQVVTIRHLTLGWAITYGACNAADAPAAASAPPATNLRRSMSVPFAPTNGRPDLSMPIPVVCVKLWRSGVVVLVDVDASGGGLPETRSRFR